MIDYLEFIDRQIFLELNQHFSPIMDLIMWNTSKLAPWIPLFLFFFLYAYKQEKVKLTIYILIGMAICILLADRISVLAFKEVFQRYRPTHNIEIGDLVHTFIKSNGEEYRGGMYGFVSSHAANFFAISTFLFFTFKKHSNYWWFLFLWAAFISYSRIYLGVHYPSDILGGAILGLGIGYIVHLSLKKLNYIYYANR